MADESPPSGPKDVLIALVVGVVMVGFLALAAVRTADLYYKAGWIVAHFPPERAVCTEAFCLRTDTAKPERQAMALHFAYCPDHLPSGFQGRRGRSVGIIIYLAIFMTVLSFVSVPILGALFRIATWPLLIPQCLRGKTPPRQLLPFSKEDGVEPGLGDKAEVAGLWTGAVVAIAAIVLYCAF